MTGALGLPKTMLAFSSSKIIDGLERFEGGNGAVGFKGMPVFRTGTFKDSRGIQATWEPEHLDQIVSNFNILKNRGIFPNVPVRDGHKGLFSNDGKVLGYVTSLTHDNASGRLLADFELTEPEAVSKLENTTFRARSAEIGAYETNDEALFWPTFMGFAFVDIGAVEGLYSKQEPQDGFVVLTDSKEHQDMPEPAQPGKEAVASVFKIGGKDLSDPAAVQAAIAGLEAQVSAAPKAFKINGVETVDFSAVQTHISALEGAAKEAGEKARKDFVAKLATDKKITQPQVEGLTKVALGLTDEAYADFAAAYEAAPTQQVLGVHAGDGTTDETDAGGSEPTEIDILEEQVAMHSRRGLGADEIAKLPSAIRLAALKAAQKKE
jgi:hypothetical protein